MGYIALSVVATPAWQDPWLRTIKLVVVTDNGKARCQAPGLTKIPWEGRRLRLYVVPRGYTATPQDYELVEYEQFEISGKLRLAAEPIGCSMEVMKGKEDALPHLAMRVEPEHIETLVRRAYAVDVGQRPQHPLATQQATVLTLAPKLREALQGQATFNLYYPDSIQPVDLVQEDMMITPDNAIPGQWDVFSGACGTLSLRGAAEAPINSALFQLPARFLLQVSLHIPHVYKYGKERAGMVAMLGRPNNGFTVKRLQDENVCRLEVDFEWEKVAQRHFPHAKDILNAQQGALYTAAYHVLTTRARIPFNAGDVRKAPLEKPEQEEIQLGRKHDTLYIVKQPTYKPHEPRQGTVKVDKGLPVEIIELPADIENRVKDTIAAAATWMEAPSNELPLPAGAKRYLLMPGDSEAVTLPCAVLPAASTSSSSSVAEDHGGEMSWKGGQGEEENEVVTEKRKSENGFAHKLSGTMFYVILVTVIVIVVVVIVVVMVRKRQQQKPPQGLAMERWYPAVPVATQ